MPYLPAILALLTGVAGWFYLFYSRAAHGLAGYEQERLNRRRVRLRRAGGVTMLLLALGFYLGFSAVDPGRYPRVFLVTWLAVLVLLMTIVVLALVDVRLTVRLRNDLRRRGEQVFRPRPDVDADLRGPDLDRTPPR